MEDVLEECLNGPKEIQARDISMALSQPFMIWCSTFGPEDKKDPLGEYEKLLFEEGDKHEKKCIKEMYPDSEEISYENTEDGFKIALEAMFNGVKSITNVPLFYLPEGIYGVADVIERVDGGESVFGNYYYMPKEIKLAINIKEKHELQTAFYCYILGKIQKHIPEKFQVINGDNEASDFKFTDYSERIRIAMQTISDIRSGKLVPTPTYNNCDWPWESYNNKEAERNRDVSLVCDIGFKMKMQLEKIGVNNIEELLDTPEEDLLSLHGIGDKRLLTFKRSAEALATGKHIVFNKECINLPHTGTELFLDLEGTTKKMTGEDDNDVDIEPIDYLIGVLKRHNGTEEYKSFVAHSLDGEETMWKEFLEWIAGQEDYVIYHWHHYERKHFEKMCRLYGCPEDLWAKISGSLIDLLPVAKKSVMFPTYGYSLKKVAPYCGFSWRQDDVTATESIAMYVAYTKTNDEKLLDKILKYNEDDVIATRVVKDWLCSQ